ncbi:hypothetical protein SAMN05518672_1011324 [Chitinophaga sp. CF118]|nr:hypothetical protein SAMN05518672_1011324 [Chitinophaga sp. CF118]
MLRKAISILPLLISLSLLSSFLYLLNKYQVYKATRMINTESYLFIYDFYTGIGYLLILIGIVLSFFIKNWLFKLGSIIVLVFTVVYIYQNIGMFNPF